MPILAPEPFVAPHNLFNGAECPSDARWWVLHTRPRTEKALVRRLIPQGVSFFLPQYEHRRRNGGRLQTSQMPLFPNYVFIHAEAEGRQCALETNCVANCIPVPDQAGLRTQLERVYLMMTSGAAIGPEERLQPGSRVEITHGCLKGMEGTVIRRGDRLTFFVEVELIRRGVSVEVESWMIQPVGQRTNAPAVQVGAHVSMD